MGPQWTGRSDIYKSTTIPNDSRKKVITVSVKTQILTIQIWSDPHLYYPFRSIPDKYAQKLITEGTTTFEQVNKIEADHKQHLTEEFANVDSYKPDAHYFQKQWTGIQQASNSITYWDTGLDYNILKYIGEKSVQIPKDFVR